MLRAGRLRGVSEPQNIFPRLTAWSAVYVRAVAPQKRLSFPLDVVPRQSAEFRGYLVATTLALDLAGAETDLPELAAELGRAAHQLVAFP
jgi:hypothetical protein